MIFCKLVPERMPVIQLVFVFLFSWMYVLHMLEWEKLASSQANC